MFNQQPPLSELERIELFTRLIDAFPHGHPLKRYRGDVYHEVGNFGILFRTMRQQGWTSDLVNQQLDEYFNSLEAPAREMAEDWTDQLRAALHEYDNYQLLLLQVNRHDGDLQEVPTSQTGDQLLALLEDAFIEKIIQLLHYLASEKEILNSGDDLLFELLHGEWFAIPSRDILQLTIEVANRQYTEYITSLRRLLYEKVHTPPKNLFTPAIAEGMKRASAAIEKLIGMVGQVPLPTLLENIVQETGIITYLHTNADTGRLALPLANFTALIREEAGRNPAMGLSLLVKLLNLKKRTAWYAPTITPNGSAMAFQALSPLYQPTTIQYPASSAMDTPAICMESPLMQGPTVDKLDTAVENQLLQRFVLHATALNNYLRCPLEFYYNILIRIPFPRNEATEFGSAVHFALEQLFRKTPGSQSKSTAKEGFIKDFEGYLHRRRASFTQEQFTRRLAYGREVLGNYFDEYAGSWNRIVTVERNFRNVMVNGVPLKGKIDKLEFDGRSANLVDYKTGDPEKSRDRLAAPGPANKLGGEYWRQGVFYKILVDNYPQKDWKVTSAEFDFIEPDKKGYYHKVKLLITPAAIETVTQQLTTVWQRIGERDFYTGCGKPGCHWCHFVKTYGLAKGAHE
jgi:hypothetical protein